MTWHKITDFPKTNEPVLARVKGLVQSKYAIVKYDYKEDMWRCLAEIPGNPGRSGWGDWFGINSKSIVKWTELPND